MPIELDRPITDETERGSAIVIPNGKYLVKVFDISKETSKKTGDPYLNVTLEILDAEKAEGTDAIGFKIFEKLSFSEKAEWRMAQFLDACYPPRFRGREIPDDIFDRRLTVQTKTETYQGTDRLRCKSFDPPFNWKGIDIFLDDNGIEFDKPEVKQVASTSSSSKEDDIVF